MIYSSHSLIFPDLLAYLVWVFFFLFCFRHKELLLSLKKDNTFLLSSLSFDFRVDSLKGKSSPGQQPVVSP